MYLQVPHDVALCICNRQLQDILCRSCGYIFVGRQRKRCPFHPNEILLMDSAVCPKCRTNSLMEIKTSEATVKKQADEILNELTNLRQRRSCGGEKCCAGAPDRNEIVDNGLGTMLLTVHASKEKPEVSRPIFAASSYTQEVHRQVSDGTKVSSAAICTPDSHIQVSEGITEHECKYVSPEVQAKLVTEVQQQPKFYQQPSLCVQHSFELGGPTAGAYKCQPKRAVICDDQNSVLKAVLKKSIAGNWDSGIDKMSDLCIGERR